MKSETTQAASRCTEQRVVRQFKVGDRVRITRNTEQADGDGWMTPIGRRGTITCVWPHISTVNVSLEATKHCQAFGMQMPANALALDLQMDLFQMPNVSLTLDRD